MRLRNKAPTTTSESHAGVVFPLTHGERATQPVGRHVISTATSRVDTAASEAARDEMRWYREYPTHFRELTRLSAGVNAGLIASDGLAALHATMRFRRQGAEGSILEAMDVPRARYFHGVTIEGGGPPSDAGLVLYDNERPVRGAALAQLLDRWVDDGTAEPSAVAALRMVDEHSEWLDLRGQTIVVMGAGAEMGPYEALLAWGAHVVAIDLQNPATWQRLVDIARRSPGRLTLPTRQSLGVTPTDSQIAMAAGADVITEAPEITEWLMQIEGPLVVGDYVYAAGATHVCTASAVDAIIAALLDRRHDVGLAYLATPTDAYAVPGAAVSHALKGFQRSSPIVAMARGLAGRRVFRPNYAGMQTMPTGRRFGVFDGLVIQQGANYALAKRIQQWRATRARGTGTWVSINVAPTTRTQSVVSNSMLEAAYGGSHRFGLRVFAPQASRQVMAALLVHDLRSAESVANPGVPLDDAMDLFASEALHGGMWRAPFEPRSVLGFAAATGRLSRS
ncbi:MAG: hypothetical protein LH645_05165 [Actinomycetia bacterium]|nr:hypothetical protein [Actinomycetes bacterium]